MTFSRPAKPGPKVWTYDRSAYESPLPSGASPGPEESPESLQAGLPDFFGPDRWWIGAIGAAPPRQRLARDPRILFIRPQIGLTATPKRPKPSTRLLPVTLFYTYSLKGDRRWLSAPYKVVRVDIDVDLQGVASPKGRWTNRRQLD